MAMANLDRWVAKLERWVALSGFLPDIKSKGAAITQKA
jgi:hypothetical protein